MANKLKQKKNRVDRQAKSAEAQRFLLAYTDNIILISTYKEVRLSRDYNHINHFLV